MKINFFLLTLILLAFIFLFFKVKKNKKVDSVSFIDNFLKKEALKWQLDWYKDGKRILVRAIKKNNEWWVDYPQIKKIDSNKAELIIKNFLSLEKKEKVTYSKPYQPSNVFLIVFEKQGKEFKFKFQELNYFKELDLILIEHENEKYLIEKWFWFGLKKELGDLFNQNIFAINPLEVEEVIAPNFNVSKKKKVWQINDHGAISSENLKKIDRMITDIVYFKSEKIIFNQELISQMTDQKKMNYSIIVKNKKNIIQQEDFTIWRYAEKVYLLKNNDLHELEAGNYLFLNYEVRDLIK